MKDSSKTKAQLIQELAETRQLLSRFDKSASSGTDKGTSSATLQCEQIIDSFTDLVMVLDKEFRITQANAASVSFFNSPAEGVLHNYCYTLMHGTTRPPEDCPLAKMLKTKKPEKAELFDEKRDMWFLISADPVFDDNGKIAHVVHTVRDISERKRVEEALRASDERSRLIAENAKMVIWMMDMDLRYTYISPFVNHNMGYTAEEYVIKPLHEVLTPSSLELCMQVFTEELENEKRADKDLFRSRIIEVEHIHRDGRIILAEINMTFIRDAAGKAVGILGITQDITERKRTESVLYRSNLLLEHAQEIAKIGYWEFNLQDGTVWASSAAHQIYGLNSDTWTIEEVQKVPLPEYRKQLNEAMSGLIERGEKYDLEFKIRRLTDAAIIDIHSTAEYIKSEGKVFGIIQDITERRQDQDACRESEAKYRALIETTGTGFVIVDQAGNVLDANSEYVYLTGHQELGEILGRNVTEWTAAYEKEKNKKAVIQCFTDGYIRNFEIDYTDAAGNITPIEINATVVEMNGTQSILTLCRDISERKQVDRDLRQSEAKYRFLAESITDVIWTTDVHMNMTYISPSVKKTLGYTPEERMNLPLVEQITPDSLSKASELLKTEIQRGQEESVDPNRTVRVELEYYCKDGSTMWKENVISPIGDKDGKLIGLHGVSRDISERKRAEKERERLQEQLTQSQKMEAIGTLAGGIAHDFNNILMAIIGYSQLALDDLSQPEKARYELQEVLKAGSRAKDLVSQILTFSRKADARYSPVSLHKIVMDSIKMMRSVLPSTIDIRHDLMDNGLIMADPTQIHQVMLNLCTNAAHAMDKTGGFMEVRLREIEIDKGADPIEATMPPGPYLCLSVSDTGHGMSPEVMARIFDPYFTTKDLGRGTGLGLAVVHGIVQSHGGAITCTSSPGKGTTFHLYLPEIMSEESVVRLHEERPLPTGTEHILFVDDEPILVELADKMLSKLGYTVLTRSSSFEALELFRKDPDKYDLVITDMTMPGMTGDRLARKLLEIRHDIPIILCSGYSEHISEDKAKKMGIREFVMKPFEIKLLADTIRKVLEGW
jgi:PAS domain S-box-containing protein